MALYHRELKWNEDFDKQINQILDNNNDYRFSKHMKENYDYKHHLDFKRLNSIIWKIKTRHYKAFEVETDDDGKVVKFVVRTPYNYDKFLDVCIVFAPKDNYVKIKTCWTNFCGDKHFSLNTDKYIN